MSVFLSSYTRALKNYDSSLFAGRTKDGLACVFRKSKRYEPVCPMGDDGEYLYNLRDDIQFVFALADNWLASGKPRDWGIEHVLMRVREIDVAANERFFEELDEHNEKVDAKNKRHLRNEIESYWIDHRRDFARATDDILTHSLSKDEPRKRLKDRSIKNGNC